MTTSNFHLGNPIARSFFITDPFNAPRNYPRHPNKLQQHEGLDLAAKNSSGQPVAVLAAQTGTVDQIGFSEFGYGHFVTILHKWDDQTYRTWYAHLSVVQVQKGQLVTMGDQIGVAGDSGNADGIHLHLTLQHLGHGLPNYVVTDVVNPEPFFQLPPVTKNEATYEADVTVADGTPMEPGQLFLKSWRIRNSGSTTWGNGYKLAFFGGDRLNGPTSVPLPPAGPGQSVEISVPLTAPSRPGRYKSIYKPRTPDGQFFNFEQYAEIEVVPAAKRDEATWLADVTVADGTVVLPGRTFLKSWRITNTGNTAWGEGYRLAFFGHNKMNGPDSVPLPPTAPGQTVEVSVSLTAPTEPGTHRSTWKPRNPAGQFFEFEQYVEIIVPRETIPAGQDEARFVTDVTVADDTLLPAGQTFTKVWRIRNSGTTKWGEGYSLAFFQDNQMNGPASVPLPPAAPNEVVDISVPLVAPSTAGNHRSTWKPRNPQGNFFDFELYAQIQVAATIPAGGLDEIRFVTDVTFPDGTLVQPGQPLTKVWRVRNSGSTAWGAGYVLAFWADNQMAGPATIPLPAAQPGQEVDVFLNLTTPTLPGLHRSSWRARTPDGRFFGFPVYLEARVDDVVIRRNREDRAEWQADVTVPAGEKLQPGQTFTKSWRIGNNGTSSWGNGYTLAFAGDNQMNGPESVPLPPTAPQQSATVSVILSAPAQSGPHRSTWQPRNPQGNLFGDPLTVQIEVMGGSFDMLQFLRGDGRLYEMAYSWAGGGRQRVQTQQGLHHHFYYVKGQEWEELWFDDNFIYRGHDTSPGEGNFYSLSENGQHGSPWLPRHINLGVFFKRSPVVIFRRKANCAVVNQFVHVTWIRLEAVHPSLTLKSGLVIKNVAELAAYPERSGRPGPTPFERYFYAATYGLVAWQGQGVGESFLAQEFAPASQPNNVRELIPCL